jgi:hypothetical protein
MFGLKTPFSHCAIKMVDGDTGQMVYYQASGLAINCVSEAEFLSKETIVYQKDVQVSEAVFKAGKTFAINQLGKPYDISAILGFALQIALGMIGIKIKNPSDANGSEYVCSQFAAAYIDVADNIDLDVREMTPKALFDAMPTLPDNWS